MRGSFTAAASALRISQPAVSQHIARLEQEIGAVLVVRSGRGLRITPPGEVLLRRTGQLLAYLRDTCDELAVTTGDDGGELRMVAFPSASATIVPPVVGAFHRRLPRVRVTLREADPPQALGGLIDGEHDLALAYDYPILARTGDPRLRRHVLAEDPMAVAVPASHPLAAAPEVPLAALADLRWVAPRPSPCREALDLVCRRAGFVPDVVSETSDYLTMLGLVAAEVGVAVVPRLVSAIAVPAGVVLRPLTPNRLCRTVSAVTTVTGHQPPTRETMVALLASMVGQLTRPDLPLRTPAPAAVPDRVAA